jgi:hypothetical protein
MRIPCKALWPPASDPIEAILHWDWIAGKMGASYPLPRPFLLALRGVRPLASETHDLVHSAGYDDTGLLFVHGEKAVMFPMATHAFQARSKLSPDVNRDGLGDVGSVRPGQYLMTNLRNGEEIIFHVTMPDGSPRLPCHRDFNGDRFLSEEEIGQSEELRSGAQVGDDGTWADSILVHGGLDAAPGAKHRFSIGCFTMSDSWRALLQLKANSTGGKIDLVLANAWDVLPLAVERAKKFTALSVPPPPDEEPIA